MGLNMKHMKWFTQCFYISRFIPPIFFRRQMCTFFCWMRCNICSYRKEKSDNSDEDHHNQVNYFIITVALKIFSVVIRIAWRPLTQIMQRCRIVQKIIDLYKFRVFFEEFSWVVWHLCHKISRSNWKGLCISSHIL